MGLSCSQCSLLLLGPRWYRPDSNDCVESSESVHYTRYWLLLILNYSLHRGSRRILRSLLPFGWSRRIATCQDLCHGRLLLHYHSPWCECRWRNHSHSSSTCGFARGTRVWQQALALFRLLGRMKTPWCWMGFLGLIVSRGMWALVGLLIGSEPGSGSSSGLAYWIEVFGIEVSVAGSRLHHSLGRWPWCQP